METAKHLSLTKQLASAHKSNSVLNGVVLVHCIVPTLSIVSPVEIQIVYLHDLLVVN